jgi:hypothetical protein
MGSILGIESSYRLIAPALGAVIFAIVNTPLFLGERQRVCSAISNSAGVVEGDDHEGKNSLVGTVDGEKYGKWLSENYGLDIKIDDSSLDDNGWPKAARP